MLISLSILCVILSCASAVSGTYCYCRPPFGCVYLRPIQIAHGTMRVRNSCVRMIPHNLADTWVSAEFPQVSADVRIRVKYTGIVGNRTAEHRLLRTVGTTVCNCPHYVQFLRTAVCGIVRCVRLVLIHRYSALPYDVPFITLPYGIACCLNGPCTTFRTSTDDPRTSWPG